MPHVPLEPSLLAALAPGPSPAAGEFRYTPAEDLWWWSDAVYAIYGFAPGEVIPTTELIARHRHPAERHVVAPRALEALDERRAFASLHRIVDARRRERVVLTVGRAVPGPGDTVESLHGYVVDLTQASRSAAQDEVEAAVAAVTVHRAAIEQAKGMLMVLQGLSGEAAFDLLRGYSQQHNIKLRVLAERLVAALAGRERPVSRAALDTLVATVTT